MAKEKAERTYKPRKRKESGAIWYWVIAPPTLAFERIALYVFLSITDVYKDDYVIKKLSHVP